MYHEQVYDYPLNFVLTNWLELRNKIKGTK